ncbi:GGDEF domain-containing protein [Candidatus Nomurabacteria bacterium]|nr:GGDEF domain-containing protein [Candidatus Kaiserbacteria bacterium]MCB9815402.1 GGDEF domain-containing protein [Candidatus Nomurabacteria bacterium]
MDEVKLLQKEVSRLVELVASQEEEIKKLQKDAELAIIDSLTGLPNRRAFEKAFDRITSELRRKGGRRTRGSVKSVGLLFVDVNKFKPINDTLGHEAGDKVLVVIAGALKKCFPRESDLVARLGGDEFVVILPRVSEEDLLRLTKKLKSVVKKADYDIGDDFEVTVSVGATLATNQTEAKNLLDRADKAMYKDKSEG